MQKFRMTTSNNVVVAWFNSLNSSPYRVYVNFFYDLLFYFFFCTVVNLTYGEKSSSSAFIIYDD